MRKLAILLLAALFSEALLSGAVRRVRVPEGGVSPDVAAGPAGEVYLVFGKDEDAFFAVSRDEAKSFSPSVRLNPEPHTVLAGHERGPKVAVGKNGVIHVVWMGAKSDGLHYVRKTAGEKTFRTPRNLLDAATNLDGATVAADESGNVLVTWLDARMPKDPENDLSLPIFVANSRDSGQTFSKNLPLKGSGLLRGCSCCALKATAGERGNFYVAFRGAYKNVRDAYVARVRFQKDTPEVRAARVHEDGWEFLGCPMAGPSLDVSSHGIWAAWMSRGRAYWAASDDALRFAEPHTPRDSKPDAANHPLVLANQRGEIFFAWEEGRTIRWEILSRDGRTLDSGDAGLLTPDSKATGFVDRDGNFCLVF